jgi:hypothetical protein
MSQAKDHSCLTRHVSHPTNKLYLVEVVLPLLLEKLLDIHFQGSSACPTGIMLLVDVTSMYDYG